MAGLRWYAHYLDDYRRDTGHLSMIEDGAYRRLLDEIYILAKPLPPNVMAVYRLARAISEDERAAVDSVLGQFFQSTPEGFVQKRARLELEKAGDISAKRSSASRARHRPLDDASGSAFVTPNASSNDGASASAFAHTPTPTSHKRSEYKSVSSGNGLGSSDCARVTIQSADERMARFQAKIAKQMGPHGWNTVIAALKPSDPDHARALIACKSAAAALGKGWPRNWPVLA